jgi:hypothetical protein
MLCVVATFTGCGESRRGTSADTDYQAVFLDNGQAFFGRVEESGPSYVTLKDVLYVPGRTYDHKLVKNAGVEIWQESDPIRFDIRHVVALIDTDYRAVLLDDGRAYFGRLIERTTDYVLLKDVFSIEIEATQERGGKTARVVLVKRENDRRLQDPMFINAGHVLAVEPVPARPEKSVAKKL